MSLIYSLSLFTFVVFFLVCLFCFEKHFALYEICMKTDAYFVKKKKKKHFIFIYILHFMHWFSFNIQKLNYFVYNSYFLIPVIISFLMEL